MVKILKASAGSGKTFRLAKTYIESLLASGDRYAYRHILAVTFTNKATAEMKNRILKELDVLARNPCASGYIKDFVPKYGSAEQISRKAGTILTDILHDYGAFAISTIDKFFQQALRAFAREIGQFASYQIELDSNSLVEESVDRILDGLTENDSELLGWLTCSVIEDLQENGRFDLEKTLYDTAKGLRSQEYRVAAEGAPGEGNGREDAGRVMKACRDYIALFEKKVRTAAESVVSTCVAAGISPDDTKNKFVSLIGVYCSAGGKKEIKEPGKNICKAATDSGEWFKKDDASMLPLLLGRLEGPLDDFMSLFGLPFRAYRTARQIRSQLYSLALAGEFRREFDALAREKNVMSLDDSDALLRRIIGGSDAPFVYEKLGVRFDSFLLDEFQDTSSLQWENFRPLLKESEGRGNGNLIVGDVKQSIYRFRGSDWRLLSSRVKEDFPLADDSESLRDNWRSLGNIVSFNNDFFRYACDELDSERGGGHAVADIYSSAPQRAMLTDGEGLVSFTFCPDDSVCEQVLQRILSILALGGRPGDIAVLCRKNVTGSEIASYLTSRGIKVISDDSLKVKSSSVVRKLVSCLSLVARPEDKIGGYLASGMDFSAPEGWNSLVSLCEEILRDLRETDRASCDREVLYVQSFMDCMSEWVRTGGNNLRDFLEWWNGSDPKISSPEDPGAVRILTVHKAKGLEFPFVIFPDPQKVNVFKSEKHWCRTDFAGMELGGVADGVYKVSLSDSSSSNTLFEDYYEEDRLLQMIDNINVFYVALTRAACGLYVISPSPDGKCAAAASVNSPYKFKNFSEILYFYLKRHGAEKGILTEPSDVGLEVFSKGVFSLPGEKGSADSVAYREAVCPSWPMAGPSVGGLTRLKYKTEAVDFFSGMPSPRTRGNIMHSILSSVVVPSDLDAAVDAVAAKGDIGSESANEYRSLLYGKLSSGKVAQWYPSDGRGVMNEVSIMDARGEVHRPDRVVVTDGCVYIIDYKTGEPANYNKQVRCYIDLFRAMGYDRVRGFIWYLDRDIDADGTIVEVRG